MQNRVTVSFWGEKMSWKNELNQKGGVIHHAGGRTYIEPGEMTVDLSEALVYGSVEVYKGKEVHKVIPWASISYIYVRGSGGEGMKEEQKNKR